jgi:hypothetical protein
MVQTRTTITVTTTITLASGATTSGPTTNSSTSTGTTTVKLCGNGGPGTAPPPGTYTWSSTPNISLSATTGLTVEVVAGTSPSSGREAETVTVTRTHDGQTTTKTLKLTVVKITFDGFVGTGAARRRIAKYGYDDYVPPPDGAPSSTPSDRHHVSVEKNRENHIWVVIEGGAVGSDFEFKSDDPTICDVAIMEPYAGRDKFTLFLKGGARDRHETTIRALCKGNGSGQHSCALHGGGAAPPVCFALIQVHVYQRVVVNVMVLKAWDSRRLATALANPAYDYTAQAVVDQFNQKTMEAVVEFKLIPYVSPPDPSNPSNPLYTSDANNVFDIPYDDNGDGALTLNIVGSSGAEFDVLRNAFPTGDFKRVVIVRRMVSNYYLARNAAAGDWQLVIQASSVFFKLNDELSVPGEPPTTPTTPATPPIPPFRIIGIGSASDGNTILTLNRALTVAHFVGEPIPFPAAGWSTDPIAIAEGDRPNVTRSGWTIVHECGHAALTFRDLKDSEDTAQATCVMHFQEGSADHRIRYLPRPRRYDPGEEAQWDHIERAPEPARSRP